MDTKSELKILQGVGVRIGIKILAFERVIVYKNQVRVSGSPSRSQSRMDFALSLRLVVDSESNVCKESRVRAVDEILAFERVKPDKNQVRESESY